MKGRESILYNSGRERGCHSLATWESHHGGQTQPTPRVSHPSTLHLLSVPQAMPALLQQVLISLHLTGIPYGLLVSSLWMSHQLFPTNTSSPLLLFTWSPIPESHLLKPSLPLLFLSPIPTDGQIPRIATTLQIHSFFVILTSTLTSSTLRAYCFYSLDIPNGFLTGSVEL